MAAKSKQTVKPLSPSQVELNSLARAKGLEVEHTYGIYNSYLHIQVPNALVPDMVIMTQKDAEMEAAARCAAKAVLEYVEPSKKARVVLAEPTTKKKFVEDTLDD